MAPLADETNERVKPSTEVFPREGSGRWDGEVMPGDVDVVDVGDGTEVLERNVEMRKGGVEVTNVDVRGTKVTEITVENTGFRPLPCLKPCSDCLLLRPKMPPHQLLR